MAISDAQYQLWLKSETARRVILVEATYYDGATERVAYMASLPFISKPTDTPANQPYDDDVLEIPKFACTLGDALEGYTVPSWGDILVDNSDFSKDAWLTYGWDGRSIKVLFGDISWARNDFRSVITGTIAGISISSPSKLKMSIRDNQWALNVPIQSRLIGTPELISDYTYKVSDYSLDTVDANGNIVVGSIDKVYDDEVLLDSSAYTTSPSTNPATFTLLSPPTGLLFAEYTGGPNATGQVVPLCYGDNFNITPVCISEAYLLYQVHGGAIYNITDVRDDGVSIPFTLDLSNGKFSLLSKPTGTVTCDVKGATAGGVYIRDAGRIMRWIIINQTDFSINNIDEPSLIAFINLCPQTVNIYIKDRINTLDVLDSLIKSVGGFYTPNRQGNLIFGRIDPPQGDSSTPELTEDDIVQGGLTVTKQSVPVQTMRLKYRRNYTTQTSMHGSVIDSNKVLYSQEYQFVSKPNPSIKIAHLLAGEPDAKETCLVNKDEASAEVDRQLTLNGSVRNTYSAELLTIPATLELGTVLKLSHPRYNLSSGKFVSVVGLSESVTNRRCTLTLRD